MRTIIRDNYTPKNGDYHEKILIDEAQNKTWLFDCDGVFTPIPTPVNVVDEYGSSTTDAASQRLVTETANNASEAIQAETEAREAADRLLQEEIEEIEMSSDVVDIVGTHAELEQYDTQHLKDNDIIKVIRDETRQNQITYYRWSTSAQDFTYVGSEGPYYTESQVDNLLDAKADKADTYTKTVTDALLDNKVDKVAGKGLSTNDFTDNDKTKLDGIEAGAQVNVQPDWDQTDATADDYIKNKPAAPTDFVGTDGQTDGAAGLVPAPLSTDAGKYLKADGTWASIVIPQSGIPTDATFWGASYDSVNNKVTGAIYFDESGAGSARRYISTSGAYALKLNAPSSGIIDLCINGGTRVVITSTGANLSNHRVFNLADPTAAQDATNKQYVDSLVISYAALNGTTAPTTATEGKYVGQLYYDTTNEQLYFLKEIDSTTTPATYTWETVGGSSVNVVQTTGTSTTDVMSQVATSQMIYPSGYEASKNRVAIGYNPSFGSSATIGTAIGYSNAVNGQWGTALGSYAQVDGTYGIAIGAGYSSSSKAIAGGASFSGCISIGCDVRATGNQSIAVGSDSRATHSNSVAIGSLTYSGRNYELSLGRYTAGSASEITRYIAHVKDPQLVTDAANKRYTDNLVISYTSLNGASAPTTSTAAQYVGQLYYDTTNDDMYYCSAITAQGTTPETYTYTWNTIGGGGGLDPTTTFWGQTASNGVVNGDMTYSDGTHTASIVKYLGATGTTAELIFGDSGPVQLGNSLKSHIEITEQSGNGRIKLWAPNSSILVRGSSFDFYAQTKITNVKNPTQAQDAATKNYVDNRVLTNAGAPTTSTVGTVGQVLEDTTNGKLYICTDATNPYVWEEVGAGGTIPTKTSDLTNDGADGTSTYVEADELAPVATSGSYTDLSNTPTVPTITMTTTDPGEGTPLAANTFIGVYQ